MTKSSGKGYTKVFDGVGVSPISSFGDFDVFRAEFYSTETEQVERGYAVVWSEDAQVQFMSIALSMSLQSALNSYTSLQQANAFQEQLENPDQMGGMAFDDLAPTDDDTIN